MSKKKSKKSVNNGLVIGLPIDDTDSNGFIRMKPTDTGKAELEKIRKRISKLTPDDYDAEDEEIKKELKDNEKEGKEKEFDPTPVSKMLDSMEEYVKAGKYGKAFRASRILQLFESFQMVVAMLQCEYIKRGRL